MILLLLALASPSFATRVSFEDQPCPLDAQDTIRVFERISANTHGGFDSDGASYSSQGQFRTYAVATCSQSLFSLYAGDVGLTLSAEDRQRLGLALAEERAALKDPGAPTVWERYGIAARMYGELGRGALFLADLWIEASWTARDEAVGVFLGLRGPAAARESLRLGEAEWKGATDRAARKTLAYNLARIAHRGGYGPERDRWLGEFEALTPHTAAEATALTRFRTVANSLEPTLQDRAIAELRRGLEARELPVETRMRATYLLADLLRRRGQPKEALGLYRLVMVEQRGSKELRELATTLANELAG